MPGRFEGKQALVLGVANRRSIAWAIAERLASEGAQLAFTYQGERIEKNVRDLAATVDTKLVTACDVRSDDDLDRVFAERVRLNDGARILDRALAEAGTRAVVFTGGTGVAPRDVTPDVIAPRLEREVPGFGELFRQLSYADIGSAAILSRALAGIAQGRIVFVLPGSRGAVRLAMEKLILPEIGHLAAEAVKTR